MKPGSLVGNLLLSALSVVLLLLLLECTLRGYDFARRLFNQPVVSQKKTVPVHILRDTPVLYGLNPQHEQINSRGLRDDEVMIPKQPGTFRILVLGDSVVYGGNVPRENTFANRLEEMLRKEHGLVEVINAGVSGYTPWNELQYYLTEGRKYQADIVMLGFCMNDVVNPRLHWGYTKEAISDIPDAAIPNHEYDINHVLPKLEQLHNKREQTHKSLADYSLLYRKLKWRVRVLLQDKKPVAQPKVPETPVYVTGEDDLSIEVLLDKKSPEWRWLSDIYDQLHAAVESDNATFVIGIFPLAYQMDVGYPYFPQENLVDYCHANAIPCLDFLVPFREYSKQDLFRLDTGSTYDIWHLTQFGHDVTAQVLASFLEDQRLLRPAH